MNGAQTKNAPRYMPERFLTLLASSGDGWASKLIIGGYIWIVSSGFGYAWQAATPGEGYSLIPAMVSGFSVLGLGLIHAIVKLYAIRVTRQTTREAKESTDSEKLIQSLLTYNAQQAQTHAQNMKEQREYYEKREVDIRRDRHKFRGRTQIACARLSNLHTRGRITLEESFIDFEQIEAAADNSDVHHTDSHL